MAKRVNGEGTIRKRGNRYQGRIVVHDDVTGESRRVTVTGATRDEVAEGLLKIRNRVREHKPAIDSPTLLGDWITKWTSGPLAVSGRRKTTQDQYAQLLATHVTPVLGGVTLKALRPSMIRELFGALSEAKSASTTRSTYAALRACLDTAVLDGLIVANPVLQVKRPSAPAQRSRALTVDQVRTLLKQANGHRIEPLIRLIATTGLRRSEALGLKWSDIDSEAMQINITRALVRDSSGLKTTPPKSDAGNRQVALAALAVNALRRQRALQNQDRLRAASAWIDSGFVFTTPAGGAMEPRNVSRAYAEIAADAGLADTGMHALRHYAATAWLSSGAATIKDVSTALGHSKTQITLDLYAAPIPEAQRAAIEQAASALD